MIGRGISVGMGVMMALGWQQSAIGQSSPYEPPDFNDPNCILDDPWVWEDFGGPIPCSGPVGEPSEADEASGSSSETSSDGESADSMAGDVGPGGSVTWEQMKAADAIPAQYTSNSPPIPNERAQLDQSAAASSMGATENACTNGSGGTQPFMGLSFRGAIRPETVHDWPDDNGVGPPDTMGAIGPRHFLEVINGNVSVFDKATGYRTRRVGLNAFFVGIPEANQVFDPRVVFDQHSGRWIVVALGPLSTGNYIFVAVSLTDDPTGPWFQAAYRGPAFAQTADFPTLGVDARAIYVVVGIADELWVIEKAPFLAVPPSKGRFKRWEANCFGPLSEVGAALQAAHTYGDPGVEYMIQTLGSNALEVYAVTGGFDPECPSPERLGSVSVAPFSNPPNAPALGTDPLFPIDTGGSHLMMAVYRDGPLWTCHCVGHQSRAACRWYEIDPTTLSLVQCGTVADESLHYYYPSLMVNADGDMVLGFSGSDATQYVAAYYAGRKSTDPSGHTGSAVLLKPGEASYTVVPSGTPTARNRWGDYSYTTLDPTDEKSIWTIQEYAGAGGQANQWGTWIGQVSYDAFDCNSNGIPDEQDIAAGTSADCNTNGRPDECEPDCNANGSADTCEIDGGAVPDCNSNAVPDMCDLAVGTSLDCNSNGIPFECEAHDCNRNCIADAQDIAGGTSTDCNGNGISDSCEAADCNTNGFFDSCDLAVGTSGDCDSNNVPDECQSDCDGDGTPDACELPPFAIDCNQNCVPDACDLTSGSASDCDADGTPDECRPTPVCGETGSSPCDPDCNSNGVEDAIDIAFDISRDADTNGVPDECENGTPAACITRVVSWKDHAGHTDPEEEYIEVNLFGRVQDDPSTVTSESRQRSSTSTLGGITELRITFDTDLNSNGPSDCPVTVFQQRKPVSGCPIGTEYYVEHYSGGSMISGSVSGNELIVTFTPGLENTRTYLIRVNTTVTSRASQSFQIRCLKADVNGSRKVDATDRSAVIGAWTGSGYSAATDISLDGVTNGTDRTLVVAAWTGAQNCAP